MGSEYDPHEHRNLDPKKATNYIETLIHLVKSAIGTGILAMPPSFTKAGLLNGIVSTIVIGIIITHCLHILIRAQYRVCQKKEIPFVNYRDAMVECVQNGPALFRGLAPVAKYAVDFFLIFFQLGVCCVYIMFIATNNKKFFKDAMNIDKSIEVHMLFILPPLIAINCIPSLKLLAPFSGFANLLQFIGLGIVIYYLLAEKKSHDSVAMVGKIADYPLYFGSVLFAMTAVGAVLSFERNMKSPKDFLKPLGVLNVAMAFVVAVYTLIGALGYLYCVSICSDVVQQDLPDTNAVKVMLVLYTIAIYITYAVQCFSAVELIFNIYLKPKLEKKPERKLIYWEYGLRIFLCLLTFALAIAIPKLGLFISLFGALCLSATALIFPAFMDTATTLPKPTNKTIIKNTFIIIVGLLGLIAGTSSALRDIINSFKKK